MCQIWKYPVHCKWLWIQNPRCILNSRTWKRSWSCGWYCKNYYMTWNSCWWILLRCWGDGGDTETKIWGSNNSQNTIKKFLPQLYKRNVLNQVLKYLIQLMVWASSKLWLSNPIQLLLFLQTEFAFVNNVRMNMLLAACFRNFNFMQPN